MSKFTKRHYDDIYNHNVSLINDLKALQPFDQPNFKYKSKEDLRNLDTLEGIISSHNNLGKLFSKDNPNFKSELWNINGVFATLRGEHER